MRSANTQTSPCNAAARAGPAQSLSNPLKPKDVKQAARTSVPADQARENAPTHDKRALRRTSYPRPSTQLKYALRQVGLRCHGGDSGIVNSHIHVYYTVVMYTYKKCYVGFCTPRRTVMDLKKIKKLKKTVGWSAQGRASSRIMITLSI